MEHDETILKLHQIILILMVVLKCCSTSKLPCIKLGTLKAAEMCAVVYKEDKLHGQLEPN